ncbi:hypothetical protein MKX01_038790, partial [Papaver californicum]
SWVEVIQAPETSQMARIFYTDQSYHSTTSQGSGYEVIQTDLVATFKRMKSMYIEPLHDPTVHILNPIGSTVELQLVVSL